MAAHTWNLCIGNIFDGISRARIFCNRIIIVINHARILVKNDIFEHRPKTDRIVNFRLARLRKANALGVTTALKIENTAIAPPVFIIANKTAPRFG